MCFSISQNVRSKMLEEMPAEVGTDPGEKEKVGTDPRGLTVKRKVGKIMKKADKELERHDDGRPLWRES